MNLYTLHEFVVSICTLVINDICFVTTKYFKVYANTVDASASCLFYLVCVAVFTSTDSL